MHVLGCLIFFVFGALFVLMALLGAAGAALRRLLFGPWADNPRHAADSGRDERRQDPRTTRPKSKNAPGGRKIFGKGEGEYVDFEELP